MSIETNYFDILAGNELEETSLLANCLEKECLKIVNFFELSDFGEKVKIIIYDNLDKFRDEYFKRTNRKPADWFCGVTFNGYNEIWILSHSEYIKTKSHETQSLDDVIRTAVHEFVHICQGKRRICRGDHYWLVEGLACVLSGQFSNCKRTFDFTLEEIRGNSAKYRGWYLMMFYVLENYGRKYILKLIDNEGFLEYEEERLYEEACKYYLEKDKINKLG